MRYVTDRRVSGPAVLSVAGAVGDEIRRDGFGHSPGTHHKGKV